MFIPMWIIISVLLCLVITIIILKLDDKKNSIKQVNTKQFLYDHGSNKIFITDQLYDLKQAYDNWNKQAHSFPDDKFMKLMEVIGKIVSQLR